MNPQFPSSNLSPGAYGAPDRHLSAPKGCLPAGHSTMALTRGSVPQAGALRVLVVEDDVTVRMFNAHVLRAAGFDVSEAANGEDGWAALRRGNFELLITDNSMPRLGGVELIARVRLSGMTLPAVLASGTLPWDEIDAPLELRPVATLPKPYDAGDLLAKIEAIILASAFRGSLKRAGARRE